MKSSSATATLFLSFASYAAADFESANIEFIKQQHESSSNKINAVDTTTAKKRDSSDAPVGFEAANIELIMQHYESSTNKKKDTDGDASASNKEDVGTSNEGPVGFEAANIELITQHYEMMNSQSSTQHRSTTSQCSKPVDITKLEADDMFHSQDSQDKCLLQLYFPNLCHGRYLEVGSDGDKQSNTHALYTLQDLGWRGVNVEVDPVSYEKLIENRKDDTNVHASTFCSESQEVIHYAKPKADDEVGGLWEYSTPEQRNQWWPEYTLDLVPVECIPLQDVIDEAAFDTTDKQYFDFMSLNIEDGAASFERRGLPQEVELTALKGIDFDRVSFGVIIIGKQGSDEYGEEVDADIEELLTSVGYEKVVDEAKACGTHTNWFVNKDFEVIYEDNTSMKTSGDTSKEEALSLKRRNLRGNTGHILNYMFPESKDRFHS